MASKFGIDTAPSQQAAAAPTKTGHGAYAPTLQATVVAPRIVQPPPAYHSARDVDGWGAPDPSETGGGGKLPRGDTFAPLTAGEYNFTGYVNSIIRWTWGTVVQFRVQTGPDAGREVDFQQTPPDGLVTKGGKGLAIWKQNIIDAYASGGWTWDPNPATGWQGWHDTGKIGGDGLPIRVAPYDNFFVQIAPDDLRVPVMLNFHVSVRAGYEKLFRITSIKAHLVNGEPVQAPMPRKVPEWIAEGHGWRGDRETLGDGKATVCKLQWDQIPVGHCGMKTRRDM